MDIEAIKTERKRARYNGMTDEQFLNSMRNRNISTKQLVTKERMQRILIKRGKLFGIVGSAFDSAKDMIYMLSADYMPENINIELSSVQDVLTRLETDGLLTAADINVINNLADKNISRAEQLGLLGMNMKHVLRAK